MEKSSFRCYQRLSLGRSVLRNMAVSSRGNDRLESSRNESSPQCSACLMILLSFSSEEEVGPLSPVAVSIAAGFSGAIAAAASHSFDTARTRAQCVILPKRIHVVQQMNPRN
ncbi:hypothetical protein YC2023_065372 [Brassica napus]